MKQNFCVAPWLSIYVDPSGRIDNCCVSKNNLAQVEQTQDFDQVFTQGKNYQVQTAMQQNQRVDGCAWCYDRSHSLQKMYWKKFPNVDDTLYDYAGQFEPRYLDLRWRNLCNYACIYCTPELSSTWAAELGRPVEIQSQARRDLQKYILDHLGTVQEIYLAGGEPLLMKEHEPILEELLRINPDCRVTVNTNLSNIKNNRMFDLLTQFRCCTWQISVEDQDRRYEYIRYPGQWSVFWKNLETLSETIDKKTIAFHMVYMNINAITIWDLVDKLIDHGYNASVITTTLYNNGVMPGPWDIKYLPPEVREQALERMTADRYRAIIGRSNNQEYVAGLGSTQYQPDMLWQELSTLDQRRGLNSRDIFPDIYGYFS